MDFLDYNNGSINTYVILSISPLGPKGLRHLLFGSLRKACSRAEALLCLDSGWMVFLLPPRHCLKEESTDSARLLCLGAPVVFRTSVFMTSRYDLCSVCMSAGMFLH